MKHVLLAGNPIDGLTVIGPFGSAENAVEYGAQEMAREEDWWVAPVVNPLDGAALGSDEQPLTVAQYQALDCGHNNEELIRGPGEAHIRCMDCGAIVEPGKVAAWNADDPHGADCAMRGSAAAECTCGKFDALHENRAERS